MKVLGAEFLTFCLVMSGLMFPGAQAVSTALEAPQTSENMLIRVDAAAHCAG